MLKSIYIKTIALFLLFLISNLALAQDVADANNQVENFQLKGRVQAVYLPGQLQEVEDVCLSHINYRGQHYILIEDFYSCPYALRFKRQLNKLVTIIESHDSISAGDPGDLATIQLQQLFPSAKLIFLEPN
jgi:hypothetical protein